LDGIPATGHERRTKVDIFFEKVVSHVDAEIKVCPKCKMENKGHFPEDMAGPLQYGQGINSTLGIIRPPSKILDGVVFHRQIELKPIFFYALLQAV